MTDDPNARRCGTCAYFQGLRLDPAKGVDVGDCTSGQYPPVRPATSSCLEFVPRGALTAKAREEPPSRRVASRVKAPEPYVAPRPPIEIEVDMDEATFRKVLRQVLQEELSLGGGAAIAERYRGGDLILRPGKQGVQDKKIPIEAFFHKVVMLRDKLRVLEQRINTNKALADDEKVNLQQYITGCYGSLTTFNVLFRDEDDKFVGASDSKE